MSHVTLRPVGGYQNGASILNHSIININEVRKWLVVCNFSHSKCLPSNNNGSPKFTILFIDTKKEVLVESSLAVPFLVLSYVWGGKDSFQTRRANVDFLKTPGSLRKHWERIPATIRDAIVLTSKLGYRFLWVDQVNFDCHSIFSHLILTISSFALCKTIPKTRRNMSREWTPSTHMLPSPSLLPMVSMLTTVRNPRVQCLSYVWYNI